MVNQAPKNEAPRERILLDPVVKFLFEKDREELLRLIGAPVRVVQILDSVLPAGELRTDGLLLVEGEGEKFILHIEFMTCVERNMAERIFFYQSRIFQRYKKPIRSVVVYLTEPSPQTEIATELRLAVEGRDVTIIRFDVVCLWEIEPDRVQFTKHPARLALAPLMKGVQANELEELAELATTGPWDERTKRDLVAMQTLLGGRRFGKDVVSSMVRRLGMIQDIIEESPLYELARQFGEARGEARGRQEGLEALRNACLELIKAKAPRLVSIVKEHLTAIADIKQLEKLLFDLGVAQDPEAVQSAIARIR
jgi:predicted transposase YdaD